MGTSITLAYLSANKSTGSVMSDIKVQAQQQTPAPTAPVTIPIPATKPAATEQPKEQPNGSNTK
jgi:preprotein translocase subunit SecG